MPVLVLIQVFDELHNSSLVILTFVMHLSDAVPLNMRSYNHNSDINGLCNPIS